MANQTRQYKEGDCVPVVKLKGSQRYSTRHIEQVIARAVKENMRDNGYAETIRVFGNCAAATFCMNLARWLIGNGFDLAAYVTAYRAVSKNQGDK